MADLVTPSLSRYPTIRPELLAVPEVIETLDTEQILYARMAKLVELWKAADPPVGSVYDVSLLEFDPLKINQESNTYFETLVRDRVNEAAKAVMLAYASGTDLDAIASRYPFGLPRKTGETDDVYRKRIWLSPDVLGPHGSPENYIFWAMSALDAGLVRDASALTTRGTGIVTIPVLMDSATTPRPTSAQILDIYKYISANSRKALTDEVQVVAPKVTQIKYNIEVKTFPGYDEDTVLENIQTGLEELVETQRWLGFDHTMMAIQGVLSQQGVYNSVIKEPTADVVVGFDGFVHVTDIELSYKGTGE